MQQPKDKSTSPKENLLHVWRAVDTRSSQMRQHNLDFIEYIWLRRMCHNFDLLGIEPHSDSSDTGLVSSGHCNNMEELRRVSICEPEDQDSTSPKKITSPMKYISVFSFLDAIRLHKNVTEIERHRHGFGSNSTKHRPPVVPYANSLPNIPSFSLGYTSVQTPEVEQNVNVNQDSHEQELALPLDTSSPGPSSVAGTQTTSEYSYTYSYSDALKYAIMYGHLEYVQYLLEHHLEQALLDTVCCPLLLVAVRLDQPDIVDLLCYHSRRKDPHNYYIDKPGCSAMECGRTALHVATEMGNIAILRVLLKYGANTSMRDDYGHTPLERVIFRLQSPHITNRTIRCINELLKCQGTISASPLTAINRLLTASSGTITEDDQQMVDQLLDIVPGPFSLKHISRIMIRRLVSYPNLPEGIRALDLPTSITKYLCLDH